VKAARKITPHLYRACAEAICYLIEAKPKVCRLFWTIPILILATVRFWRCSASSDNETTNADGTTLKIFHSDEPPGRRREMPRHRLVWMKATCS